MYFRIYFATHSVHNPVNIISDKLYYCPNTKKNSPQRKRARNKTFFMLRKIDERIKKRPVIYGTNTIRNCGNNSEQNQNNQFLGFKIRFLKLGRHIAFNPFRYFFLAILFFHLLYNPTIIRLFRSIFIFYSYFTKTASGWMILLQKIHLQLLFLLN